MTWPLLSLCAASHRTEIPMAKMAAVRNRSLRAAFGVSSCNRSRLRMVSMAPPAGKAKARMLTVSGRQGDVTRVGEIGLLAACGHPADVTVSKYGVDLAALERVGVAALRRALDRGHVMVADEIGKMQLYSRPFRQTILEAVRQGHPLLGTIM